MHRAAGGSFEGKHVRDLRRTTVHDASSTAWGLNEQADTRPGFNSNGVFLNTIVLAGEHFTDFVRRQAADLVR